MRQYNIVKKQNVFTTARGEDVPVLTYVGFAESISEAADKIVTLTKSNLDVADTYFITENPEWSM